MLIPEIVFCGMKMLTMLLIWKIAWKEERICCSFRSPPPMHSTPTSSCSSRAWSTWPSLYSVYSEEQPCPVMINVHNGWWNRRVLLSSSFLHLNICWGSSGAWLLSLTSSRTHMHDFCIITIVLTAEWKLINFTLQQTVASKHPAILTHPLSAPLADPSITGPMHTNCCS